MTDPAKQPCEVHRYHSPKPLVIVKHHLVPLSCGGWDTRDNYVYVCDSGHRNLHHLIGALYNDDPMPKGGTRMERALAKDSYARWVAMGKPGNRHGAYGLHAPDAPHDLPPAA
jgi:hypothetical protein